MPGADKLLNLDPTGLATIVLRTVVVYTALLALLRLSGKRELGQMTPFDLVVLLIISNAVQSAMVGPDVSLTGGLVAATTLVLANRVVAWLSERSPRVRARLVGSPALLVHEGRLLTEHLRSEHVTEDEVLQALREHGVEDLGAVKDAILEPDGTISVIPMEAPSSRTRRRVRGRKPAS